MVRCTLGATAGLGDAERIAPVCSLARWNGEELLVGGRTAVVIMLGGPESSTRSSARQLRGHGAAAATLSTVDAIGVAWLLGQEYE